MESHADELPYPEMCCCTALYCTVQHGAAGSQDKYLVFDIEHVRESWCSETQQTSTQRLCGNDAPLLLGRRAGQSPDGARLRGTEPGGRGKAARGEQEADRYMAFRRGAGHTWVKVRTSVFYEGFGKKTLSVLVQ